MNEPLAERVRPKLLKDYISQQHLVGDKGILTNLIKQGIPILDCTNSIRNLAGVSSL